MIKLSNTEKTEFFQNTKKALETFQGSPITKDKKVREFFKNQFLLEHENVFAAMFNSTENSNVNWGAKFVEVCKDFTGMSYPEIHAIFIPNEWMPDDVEKHDFVRYYVIPFQKGYGQVMNNLASVSLFDANEVNPVPLTHEQAESSIGASMWGWHAPIAKPALDYIFDNMEPEIVIQFMLNALLNKKSEGSDDE